MECHRLFAGIILSQFLGKKVACVRSSLDSARCEDCENSQLYWEAIEDEEELMKQRGFI